MVSNEKMVKIEPNRVYKLLGSTISALAEIGATDKELKQLFKKGGKVTIYDVAKVEHACFERCEQVKTRETESD